MSSIRKQKSTKHASNNPYKQMNESLLNNVDGVTSDIEQHGEQQEQQQAFMSFTPKKNSVINTDIQRRYTQKKQPPNASEFMSEFEQETTKPLTRQDSQNSYMSMVSYDDEPENESFSDTARLTANASSQSGFTRHKSTLKVINDDEEDYRPNRASFQSDRKRNSKLYEPAFIDPAIDERNRRLKRIIHYDKKSALKRISRAIRRTSKRVINVHDNNNDSFLPQPQSAKSTHQYSRNHTEQQVVDYESDTSSSLAINEVIPMNPASTNSSKKSDTKAIPISNVYYLNPQNNDTKEYLYLKGKSLKLFSSTNPIRLFFAKTLCLK